MIADFEEAELSGKAVSKFTVKVNSLYRYGAILMVVVITVGLSNMK